MVGRALGVGGYHTIMGQNRKTSSFPLYDTKTSPDAEKGQILLAHNMDKRMACIVTTLPNWGNKGVKIGRAHV